MGKILRADLAKRLDMALYQKHITIQEQPKVSVSPEVKLQKATLTPAASTGEQSHREVVQPKEEQPTEQNRSSVQKDKEGNKLNPITLKGVEGSDPKRIAAKLSEINEKACTRGEYFNIGTLFAIRTIQERTGKDFSLWGRLTWPLLFTFTGIKPPLRNSLIWYITRPPYSIWRIFIQVQFALIKMKASPSRTFFPIWLVTMPLSV
jgi:hypothetical protein